MTSPRTPKPSPLAGEGGERRIQVSAVGVNLNAREPGEGASSHDSCDATPSPASLARARSAPSPARGEGGGAAPSGPPRRPVTPARRLRANMTDAERKLWFALRDRRLAGYKFRRQVPVGSFIVDFLSYPARLVIEVDGGQHSESSRDIRRDQWLGANNFRVLRFWNHDVLSNIEGVLTVILDSLGSSSEVVR
jgi:very-short-patch-repair endonuclease